jgi:tail tube GTA-gp10-like protein
VDADAVSRDGSIELTFHDGGQYVFRLAWGELIRLQEERKCGPLPVLERLHSANWMVEDISEVTRLGLIGGGLDPIEARMMVRQYVENDAPMKSLPLACEIIRAGMIPPEDEELEKPSSGGGDRVDNLPNGCVRIGAVYGAGALMHYTPQQVDRMSWWQFTAACMGWAKQFQTSGLTETDADDLWNWLQEKDDVALTHRRAGG